jgi:hypothetical protein
MNSPLQSNTHEKDDGGGQRLTEKKELYVHNQASTQQQQLQGELPILKKKNSPKQTSHQC